VLSMLREALRCPVERFDPFARCDLSDLPPAMADELGRLRAEAVPVLGLVAGRLDDELYGLEILPERVKRRQRFVQRTVYDIGAAAVAAALLAALFVHGKDRLAAATRVDQTVRAQVKRVESTHTEAVKLQERNAQRRQLVEALAQRTVPLDGGLRVLRALQDTMPPEFWLASFELKQPSRGVARTRGEANQVFVVKGKGKPVGGVDLGRVYRDFLAAFTGHALIRGARVTPERKDLELGVSEFTFEIDVLGGGEVKEKEN